MRRTKKMKLRLLAAVLAVAVAGPARLPAQDKGASADEAKEAAYAQALEKRARGVLDALRLNDPDKAARVHDAVIAQYRALRDWHAAHDGELKDLTGQLRKAGGQARAVEGKISQVKASLKTLHDQFLAKLAEQLSPDQVETVKDQMTYNKVRVTYDAYCEIVPGLTGPEKARILEFLKEAREEAMDAGSADDKSAVFKKYKGKINNDLSARGHDVAQAYRDWGEKQKAKGAKTGPPPG
jgi:DNA-binding TFAR19-related protein (PDSD5 family)